MTMTQTAGVTAFDGLSGVPEKDDARFRIDNGGTSGDKSDLLVLRYLGGFYWVGTGTPNGHITGFSVKDRATDLTTGIDYRWVSTTSWVAVGTS